MSDFKKLERWWRTDVPTEVVLSEDGVGDLLRIVGERKSKPFFIIDKALEGQQIFAPVIASNDVFRFDATASEPRTSDVDMLVKAIKSRGALPDVIVGVGGGSTMDLSKAVAICLTNPKSAAEYQGWGFDMVAGVDCWVLPTLIGTGAEITPIAVLRGPEKKLGINTPLVAAKLVIVDPMLSEGAKKFNRFYTMMDCYFHHREVSMSKTSEKNAILDAEDGLELSRKVLSHDLSNFDPKLAVLSAKASVLGGSSTIGGRVGAAHAISYGLSNASPTLPHSVAVSISMLSLADLYENGAHAETLGFMNKNGIPVPKARDYGINKSHIAKMVKTALGMDKLWLSHFGDGWEKLVTTEFLELVYTKIVSA